MKTIKNVHDEIVEITELESQVIDALESVDNPEYFFIDEISTNIPQKQLRGVLSSLVKKYLIDINTKEGGLVSIFYTIID